MHYHVCKFSIDVKHSYRVPVPREDGDGFISAVKQVIHSAKIDFVIPIHEEIFYLARAAESDHNLRSKLFAPPFKTLIQMHSKWQFSRFLESIGMDAPDSRLCKRYKDVQDLDPRKEWALKPVFGRASLNVFHLRPGKPLPQLKDDGLNVGDDNHYVAQEWLYGQRYCSYAVLQNGCVAAFALYPVKDTIDGTHWSSDSHVVLIQTDRFTGSSCVYFQAVEHPRIHALVDKIAQALPDISCQIAFDFIETPGPPSRLVAIECNPRATSGIYLFSGTPSLVHAITSGMATTPTASTTYFNSLPPSSPSDPSSSSSGPPSSASSPLSTKPTSVSAKPGARRQLAPGMLMWRRTKADKACKTALKEYVLHMKRLMCSRDVVFSGRDLLPSLMQPFLLTSYYEICRERKMNLPTMFQWDVIWDPKGEELENVREMFDEKENK
jgi:hypothetical protein